MRMKLILLAGVAAMTMAGCGKKEAAGSAPAAKTAAADAQDASPLDQPFRLADAKAADVDALIALIGDKAKVTYDSKAFDQKLGATVLTNVRIEDRAFDRAIKAQGVSIDRAELYGVDMDAINKVKTGTSAPDAPFEKVFDQVRLFGIKPDAEDDGGKVTIGALEVDTLQIRDGGVPDKEGEAGNVARAFNAFSLGGLYFKDIEATKPESSDNPAGGANMFKAADLRLVGLGGGKLAAIIAKDAEYSLERSAAARAEMAQKMGPAGALLTGPLAGLIAPDNARVTLKSFTWKGVDLSGLMAYGLKGEEPPITAKNLIDLGVIRMTDAQSYISGRKACHTDETAVTAMQFTWLAPSKIHMEQKGGDCDYTAYVDPSQDKTIAALKAHGLDRVTGLGGVVDWTWDTSKGNAGLSMEGGGKTFAEFSMSLDLAGMDLAKIKAANDAGEKDAAAKIGAFKGFDMKLVDHNLLDAIYDLAALQMGGSAADLKQSTPAMVRLSGAQAASMFPEAKDYVNAIADFLGEGGSLEITAQPKQPVSLETIEAEGEKGPQGLPKLLNLKVTRKK